VIDAAMCGYEYSGLAKILNVFESEHFRLPRRSMKVLRETEVSLAFDGGNNVGMLALFHAAQATIKKIAAHGIALVSVSSLLAILLSHGHRDHWGLIPHVRPDIPIVMGQAAECIMRAAADFVPDGFAPKSLEAF
jgi:glyoxylase-like metal-dependent hydrolase (beta-lactamase superfamily II)